ARLQGHGGEAGDQYDAQGRVLGARTPGELDAVEPRHDDVGDEQLELLTRDELEGIGAVVDGDHVVSCPLESACQEISERSVIFGEQNTSHATILEVRGRLDADRRGASPARLAKP